MSIDRQHGGTARARPWWRPSAYSTAVAAAVAMLFHPLPASAAPRVPAPAVPAVPDPGSRPQPLGSVVMPGQKTPATISPVVVTPGVALSPLLQKIEKQRTEIAALGDRLIKVGEERDLARQQVDVATKKVADTGQALIQAQAEAAAAAAAALRDQAALPPGTLGSGLADLDALSRMQRGEVASDEAATRHLAIVQAAQNAAMAEQATTTARATDRSQEYDRLNADLIRKQSALQKDETRNAGEISAAEAAQSAEDRRLGEGYLDGAAQGRGADPRAVAAVTFALAQRGDPYVWSEEGPDQYDCSGLMFAAYRSAAAGNFPLVRVSRDQYWQTRTKAVDRYSLLPGDLLFFSSTSSWTGIHHVAMYAGNGMMVEAPRTGLNVRLVPVRWSRLFQATRIYGSVDGPTEVPDPGTVQPETPQTTRPTPKPSASTTTPPAPRPSSTRPRPPALPSSPALPSTSTSPSPSGSSASPSASASTSVSPSASSAAVAPPSASNSSSNSSSSAAAAEESASSSPSVTAQPSPSPSTSAGPG